MTTKDNFLFLKDKQQNFVNSSSQQNSQQYSNLNLNKFQKNSNKSSLFLFDSKSKNDKQFATFVSIDHTVTHNFERRSQSLNQIFNSKICNPVIFHAEKEEEKQWKKGINSSNKNSNTSTLSLHISAYENSIQESSSDLLGENKDLKMINVKQRSAKNWKNAKFNALTTTSTAIQNPFEFPRQQEDKKTEPEVMQFKASQQLLNPCQSIESNQQNMEDDSIYAACPIRSQLTDFGEKLQHTWVNCNICCRLKQKADAQNSSSIAAAKASEPSIKSEPAETTNSGNPSTSSDVTPNVVSYSKPAGRARIAHQSKVKAEPLEMNNSTNESSKSTESHASESATTNPITKSKTFPNKKPQNEKKEEVPVGRRAKDRLEMKRMKDNTENFDKKEAALKIVESRRTENQQKSVEKPKTVVAPSNMPWVPNPHFLLPNNSISALSLEDHRRYVAIITNFTRMDKALRFEFNNIELESMDAKLKPERQKFMAYIKEEFLKKDSYSATFNGGIDFGLERLKKRLCTVSDAGYHSIVGEVEWRSNTRSIANRNMYVKKPKMLSLGKSKKLEMPDPSRRCVFERDANVLTERYPCDYTTKTLRDDPQALEFGVENDVTAILSSSAMRHLLTSHFPLRQYRRAFPVSVFRKFINGAPQRVVCIGNHVPITPPSKPDLMKTFAKYIVRNAMEKRERQKQERIFKGVRSLKRPLPTTKDGDENNADGGVEQKKIKVEVQEAEENKEQEMEEVEEEKETNAMTESSLMIDDEEENDVAEDNHEEETEKEDVKPSINNDEVMNVTIESTNTTVTPTESGAGDSLLDRLFASTTQASPIKEKEQKPIKTEIDVLDSILGNMEENPNVSNAPVTSNPYSYMVVPVDNDGTHKVLVRSRPHGRDIANTPISITSKLQYIPQCGAEESFMEEKIWNALTGALKESTYQADIHLNIPETHCLQLTQNRSIKMFEALPEEAKELLSGRWQRFYNLLEEIKQLQDGEYLLVENDDEMLEIWTEAAGEAKWTRQIIEEKSLLTNSDQIYNESIEFSSRFNGIAIHTPLIWHIVKSRIPASFLPPNPNKNYVHRGGGRGGGDGRGGGFRGGRRGGGRGRSFKGRGRGGDGRGRGRGGSSNRGKPTVYTDLDANPFDLFDQ